MPRSTTRSTARIYRLKITLRGTTPPVWRRILVPGDITLDQLHRVFQIVMGWTDSHLHQFHVGDVRYGDPTVDVVVEQIAPADQDQGYPLCIGGRGACPPEDVGGIGGYYEFLEAIGDPEHPEHDSWLTWVGGEFDYAVFDYRTVNHVLLWLH